MGHKRSISYLKGHFFFSFIPLCFHEKSIRFSCYDHENRENAESYKLLKLGSYFTKIDQLNDGPPT